MLLGSVCVQRCVLHGGCASWEGVCASLRGVCPVHARMCSTKYRGGPFLHKSRVFPSIWRVIEVY